MATNITPQVQDAFQALTSGEYSNFALVSCFCNGEPTSVIAIVTQSAEGGMGQICPLFVAVTPSMILTDHDGVVAEQEAD
jgi:hypothetical protein